MRSNASGLRPRRQLANFFQYWGGGLQFACVPPRALLIPCCEKILPTGRVLAGVTRTFPCMFSRSGAAGPPRSMSISQVSRTRISAGTADIRDTPPIHLRTPPIHLRSPFPVLLHSSRTLSATHPLCPTTPTEMSARGDQRSLSQVVSMHMWPWGGGSGWDPIANISWNPSIS